MAPDIEQLVLEAPLILAEHDSVALQVVVGAPDEAGERSVGIYSRLDGDGVDRTWMRHAQGVLAPSKDEVSDPEVCSGHQRVQNWWILLRSIRNWLHAGTSRAGVSRPAFGVALRRRVVRRGGVAASTAAEAGRFGLHPVLLDAVLHGIGAGSIIPESELTRLPFEWEGVSLNTIGENTLRARIMLVGSDTVAVTLMDGNGALVGRIESLALRGISPHRLRPNTIGDDALYQVDWIALTSHDGAIGVPSDDDATDNLTVVRCPETNTAGDALGESTYRLLAQLLEQVQSWLSSDSHGDEARLVVITRGAIAVDTSEDVADLGQAAGWGPLRSAQNENPGASRWSTSTTGPTRILRWPEG